MVEMEVMLRELTGTHITPLTQNILLDDPLNTPLPEILLNNPLRQNLKTNFLRTINDVTEEILSFLETSISPSSALYE